MSRHPHTWRFYRKRYRGFCRRLTWLLALVVLGMAGGIENGSLPLGLTLFEMALIGVLIVYAYSVGYGIKRGDGHA